MKKINIENLAKTINQEEFKNYYLTHNLVETTDRFNLRNTELTRRVRDYFGIVKSKEDINTTRLNTAKLKYGSLENYYKIKNERASKAQLSISEEEKQRREEKKKSTNLKRYGVEQPSQRSDYNDTRKRNIEAKGITYEEYYKNIVIKCKETKLKNHGDCNYNNIQKYKHTCQEKFGVPYACMRKEARNFSSNSKPNLNFSKLLDLHNIKYEREFVLENYSYDFKIGNILIEINPFATHNSTWGIRGQGLDPNYHYNKTKTASDNNYKCINVWDWDNVDKIINILTPKQKVYARNCILKELSKPEAYNLIDLNHLQGNCNNQKIFYGLYYKNKLIQVMTFGPPRYNKKYQYELLRLCTDFNYLVVGGAERLFKHFQEDYKPTSIISYCDKSKFKGEIYLKLGFKEISPTRPSKHWYNPKTKKHITDNLLRQLGADKLLNTNYGKNTNNEEIMKEHNFIEIYDCGQSTYTLCFQ